MNDHFFLASCISSHSFGIHVLTCITDMLISFSSFYKVLERELPVTAVIMPHRLQRWRALSPTLDRPLPILFFSTSSSKSISSPLPSSFLATCGGPASVHSDCHCQARRSRSQKVISLFGGGGRMSQPE